MPFSAEFQCQRWQKLDYQAGTTTLKCVCVCDVCISFGVAAWLNWIKVFYFFILFACLLCFGHSSGLCLNFFSSLDKLAASLNRKAVGQQFQSGQCEPLDSSTSPMLLLNFILFAYSSLVVSQFTYTNQSVSADKNKKKAITICCGHISLFCSMANYCLQNVIRRKTCLFDFFYIFYIF